MGIQEGLKNLDYTISIEKNSKYTESKLLAERIYQKISNNLRKEIFVKLNRKFLEELINKSIIINNYPKRIIKKGTGKQSGTKFEASIICLLKSDHLTISPVNVKPYLCGENENDKKELPYQLSVNHNYWSIKDMKWKQSEAARSSRRSTCEKKIVLFDFTGDYKCTHFDGKISKKLYSETVVIVVHSNQEPDGLITLFWDDYYPEEDSNRTCPPFRFSCVNTSLLENLIENLSDLFLKETGRFLTIDNKAYLLQRARGIFPHELIRLDEFMKLTITPSKLSFGQWIMSIIKMLKIPSLEIMWRKDLIEGFIHKDVKDISLPPWTFLLRFSERQAAIGVVTNSEINEIEAWDPYSEANLKTDNLANLLSEFPCLRYVRLATGETISTSDGFVDVMNPVQIDDGYTARGGTRPNLDMDLDDLDMEACDATPDFENDTLNMDNCNIDDIEEGCNILLQSPESLF